MTGGGPGHATEILVTYIYKLGVQPDPLRLCRRRDRGLLPPAAGGHLGRQPAVGRQCRRRGARLMISAAALAHPPRIDRGVLRHAGAVLLGAEDRRSPARTSSPIRRASSRAIPTRFITSTSGMRFRSRATSSTAWSCRRMTIVGQRRAERHGRLRADARHFRGKQFVADAVPVLHDDPVPGHHHPGLSDHRQARPARIPISAWRCRCSPPSSASSCSRRVSTPCRAR